MDVGEKGLHNCTERRPERAAINQTVVAQGEGGGGEGEMHQIESGPSCNHCIPGLFLNICCRCKSTKVQLAIKSKAGAL